jgi:hypothetical protein
MHGIGAAKIRARAAVIDGGGMRATLYAVICQLLANERKIAAPTGAIAPVARQ